MEEQSRLNELDADEMFDVARVLKPELTREEFDVQWVEFEAEKRRKAVQ